MKGLRVHEDKCASVPGDKDAPVTEGKDAPAHLRMKACLFTRLRCSCYDKDNTLCIFFCQLSHLREIFCPSFKKILSTKSWSNASGINIASCFTGMKKRRQSIAPCMKKPRMI
jgi:hypothetical protein